MMLDEENAASGFLLAAACFGLSASFLKRELGLLEFRSCFCFRSLDLIEMRILFEHHYDNNRSDADLKTGAEQFLRASAFSIRHKDKKNGTQATTPRSQSISFHAISYPSFCLNINSSVSLFFSFLASICILTLSLSVFRRCYKVSYASLASSRSAVRLDLVSAAME